MGLRHKCLFLIQFLLTILVASSAIDSVPENGFDRWRGKGRWNMEGEVYRVADASHQQARNMYVWRRETQCRTATPVLSGL
ncbi:hypothetical protein BDP81DRAFT_441666 [Colletotrichum phormii]|uniref:Secreted protein n=1 Tax=Colletotrichum phormii TaxID=359342 RepID=A0AAI9ZF33_9PEZI|nr:uncharacterized protein BDP81DRAFT_441666 [Colletotrichum phormii]KAK1622420.1 hypothetical protein BDP81DRAFT_441666 [Colletotrichum phormii]